MLGANEGKILGSAEGIFEGSTDGISEGSRDGVLDGISEGTPEGSVEGAREGTPVGKIDGALDGENETVGAPVPLLFLLFCSRRCPSRLESTAVPFNLALTEVHSKHMLKSCMAVKFAMIFIIRQFGSEKQQLTISENVSIKTE